LKKHFIFAFLCFHFVFWQNDAIKGKGWLHEISYPCLNDLHVDGFVLHGNFILDVKLANIELSNIRELLKH